MFRAERAKELIKEQGRTREWIAQKCGVSHYSISQYLNGQRNPSLPVIKLLAATLEVQESELLEAPKEKAS